VDENRTRSGLSCDGHSSHSLVTWLGMLEIKEEDEEVEKADHPFIYFTTQKTPLIVNPHNTS